ncbi:hypothetical protein AYO38_07660 [bacterium SCGC AG-212-C10]|nr:hypothetical protein AYO38_07660 [bacterium SCGC AG-212-C10]
MALAGAVTLAITGFFLGPELRDLAIMGLTLVATVLAGTLLARIVARKSANLPMEWQLSLFSVVGVVGLVLNVGVAASLMFLSPHDLALLSFLSAFALVASIPPAQGMARSVSGRLETLREASSGIADGNLAARVTLQGTDEIARVGESFNSMAAALERSRRERDDLERARRDLFAAISHDLRTPLSVMRVMVEAIADGVVTDSETHDRYLASMAGEIRRLTLLVDDLFELTKIDSGELRLRLEAVHVEDLVASTVDSFRPQVEQAGIHLKYQRVDDTPIVQGDAQRLSRVLANLLQNAIRHTPNDGTISVRTELVGPHVRLTVSDTGDGIAQEDAPHVFDRFYRGDRARGRDGAGSGLGLAIARGIVEAHGGNIWLEPAGGPGATFAFTLPAGI